MSGAAPGPAGQQVEGGTPCGGPPASDTLRQTYDDLPYDSRPIPASHVEVLAVEGHLAGLAPAPIERCRVLELGCASGNNLLPMAEEFPASAFVGLDLSPVQIDRARAGAGGDEIGGAEVFEDLAVAADQVRDDG